MASDPAALARFATWLDTSMDNRGLNNRQLAERVGVSESMVGRWLAGRACPQVDSLQRLATVFGVNWVSLAVTAGRVDGNSAGVAPLPVPSPLAVRTRLEQQMGEIRGLPASSIEAALRVWDEENGLE